MTNKASRKRHGRHRKNRTMKKAICSPTNKKKSYTCYTDEALDRMKDLWNARHPDAKILSQQPREIWETLRDNMADVCNIETCWLRQQFIANKLTADLTTYTFAPTAPKVWHTNINEWLTSVDIERVMKQYEKKYKHFDFIGPSPIDFDKRVLYDECVWSELCNFDLAKLLRRGKTKIGVVFNVDPHYLEGSHWISLFINVPKGYIFFFDSNGERVPKQIKHLVTRIQEQARALNIDLKFEQNHPTRHQMGDTECGMYSLYLIIQLLTENKTPQHFMKQNVTDDEMEHLRKKYFNFER